VRKAGQHEQKLGQGTWTWRPPAKPIVSMVESSHTLASGRDIIGKQGMQQKGSIESLCWSVFLLNTVS
jgi:hypothetical protein